MPIPRIFDGRLALPLIGSPMFLASGVELVLAQCKAGIAGSFPTLNARTPELLEEWLLHIRRELDEWNTAHPERLAAPFGANLILHKSNPGGMPISSMWWRIACPSSSRRSAVPTKWSRGCTATVASCCTT